LGHLEDRVSDLVSIADADFGIGKTFYGEVLPELPPGKVVASQVLLPVSVGCNLINEDGTLLAAVPSQITLSVACEIKPTHHTAAFDGVLPYRRVHRPALPRNVPR
jgi:hypothetical protein